jgi:uncharacterized protein (TIGR00369 family)
MQPTEQMRRREWFRDQWTKDIAFNQHCGMQVRRWDDEAVELFLPYAEVLSSHPGIFHGGVVSGLLDTTGAAAVMAGHDFTKGSRLTTISLSVQFLTVSPGEDLLATGHCTRRGRSVHFAHAEARAATSGKLLATAQVALNISGEHPSAPWPPQATPPAPKAPHLRPAPLDAPSPPRDPQLPPHDPHPTLDPRCPRRCRAETSSAVARSWA